MIDETIDPGHGYRLLEYGDWIQENDEVWTPALRQWVPTMRAGLQVGHTHETSGTYRRKLEEPKAEEPKPAIDPGPGYRLLERGEILRKGDQFQTKNGAHWLETRQVGKGVFESSATQNTYRRKLEEPKPIDPGPGYRLLEVGETILPNDEAWSNISRRWDQTKFAGEVYGSHLTSGIFYRRKLKAPTRKKIYIAGPMRGIPKFNFPAFDDAAERLYNQGWDPINPADIDRDQGFDVDELPADFDWGSLPETLSLRDIIRRDLDAVMSADAVYVLPGYERSRGSRAEIALAEWLNLEVIYEAKEPEAPVAPAAINAELHQAAEPHFNWADGIAALKAAEAEEPSNPFDSVFDALKEREAAEAGAQSVKSAFSILKAAIDDYANEDILETALRITKGDRQAQYGPPDQDFRRTAGMWTALFSHMLNPGASFEPMQVALAMVLLKASRQIHQRKRDNWVDIAGYARCGSICDEVA